MAATAEQALSDDQRKGALVKGDAFPYVVWRFRQNLSTVVGLAEVREVGGDWYCEVPMTWTPEVALEIATILDDIEAGKPPPPIAEPKLAELKIDQWTKDNGKWIVRPQKGRILAIYDHLYVGKPSVMLREYDQKKGMRIRCYWNITKPTAFKIAKHMRALSS
jgi:hypothetical protein